MELLLVLQLLFKVAAVGAGSTAGRSHPGCAFSFALWIPSAGGGTQENSPLLKGTFLRVPNFLQGQRGNPLAQAWTSVER